MFAKPDSIVLDPFHIEEADWGGGSPSVLGRHSGGGLSAKQRQELDEQIRKEQEEFRRRHPRASQGQGAPPGHPPLSAPTPRVSGGGGERACWVRRIAFSEIEKTHSTYCPRISNDHPVLSAKSLKSDPHDGEPKISNRRKFHWYGSACRAEGVGRAANKGKFL